MTARSPSALMVSAALHGAVAALILLFSYAIGRHVTEAPKVFELVAGEGDNYGALEAPAAGVAGGIKIDLPEPPAPIPTPAMPPPSAVTPPSPVEAAPEPQITKVPVEKKPVVTKPADTVIPNFSKQITRTINRKESKAKQEVKKEREAEQKRISKLEYDRLNKTAKASTASGNPKVKRIDAEGIAGGVTGGSTANKTGGAGGKALTREQGELMDAYFSLVKRKLKDNLDKPPGLSDSISATAEFRVGADGSISGARISSSSGSDEFDRAVLDAISRFRSIGPRPDHKGETVNLIFRMREEDSG
ncbi:MAG: protein TolA [Verrucomicrobia bacterium]|nr:protein TolA [Verrucomicrobiota bacterium]